MLPAYCAIPNCYGLLRERRPLGWLWHHRCIEIEITQMTERFYIQESFKLTASGKVASFLVYESSKITEFSYHDEVIAQYDTAAEAEAFLAKLTAHDRPRYWVG